MERRGDVVRVPNHQKKTPCGGLGGSQRPRLPWTSPEYSPALAWVTTGFGMGPGGSTSLSATSPPDGPGVGVAWGRRSRGGGTSLGGTRPGVGVAWTVLGHEHGSAPVGCPPSTCRLATRSSAGGLTLLQDGDPRLGEGFPLRCFQRFARPDVATQRCRWFDNWHTSGPSSPVLSY